MITQFILKNPTIALSVRERQHFFEQGYIKLDAYIKEAQLQDLHRGLSELLAKSGGLTASNRHFELADNHTPDQPHPVVMKMVADVSPNIWRYVTSAELTDLAVDLLGPDVKFREAYINYKKAEVGRSVSWHQDFPFFPTTNRAMITVLTYFEEVTPDMGPIQVLPKSHRGPLYDHYDNDEWIGRLPDQVLAELPLQDAVSLAGPAGTVIIFDNFIVHGSQANRSARSRPVLVTGYAAADAFPYTATPPSMRSPRTWQLIRGNATSTAHHEPIKVRVPPDWAHQEYTPPDWPERDLVSKAGYHADERKTNFSTHKKSADRAS